jgi:predicted RNase H-like HicB family nuclease
MPQRFYPAVLERGARETFGVWFPDFPACVAAARSQDEAMARAQESLAHAVDALAERGEPLPPATDFDAIVIPKGCKFVAFFAVGVEPPDPSERVNVYLPRSLIARVDRMANELGMSRSSFFGLAVSRMLAVGSGFGPLPALSAYTSPAPRTKTELRRRGG